MQCSNGQLMWGVWRTIHGLREIPRFYLTKYYVILITTVYFKNKMKNYLEMMNQVYFIDIKLQFKEKQTFLVRILGIQYAVCNFN